MPPKKPSPPAPSPDTTVDSVLADAKALSQRIAALVGPPAALTQTDYRRATKMPKGGEGMIPILAAVVQQIGLNVPSHPTTTMVEKLNEAQSLIALHKEMVTATKQVGDALFLAESASWEAATVHYSVLRRLGRKDGAIQQALAPVIRFFASRANTSRSEEKAKREAARAEQEKA